MFKYFPHTQSDIDQMLDKIGVDNVKDLFAEIKPELICNKEFNLPHSHSEHELRQHINDLGKKNSVLTSFLGAGRDITIYI